MNTPSERFKAVRKELGLTQNEFAKELNISQVAVYKLEEGQIKSISQEVTKILEEKFGINKIWLHFGEGMMYLDDTTNMYSVYNKLEYLSKLCEGILARLGGSVISSSEKRGRGRPRKTPMPVDIDPSAVKRGRGRPRKNVEISDIDANAEKRGPGRPRKNPISSDENKVKRSVGRPRIKPIEDTANKEKRSVGRPRKNPVENAGPTIKRSVGRPRKNNPIDTEAKVKRSVGRPAKTITATVEVGEKKRGRGRPAKNAATTVAKAEKKSGKGPGRPPKNVVNEKAGSPAVSKKRGRPSKK